MHINDYFRIDDPHPPYFGAMKLPEGWWSRAYEYDWAFKVADVAPGMDVADMGCGYTYRPFKTVLAASGCNVLAVDINEKVKELHEPEYPNLKTHIQDMRYPIRDKDGNNLKFDRIFCLSVLEDMQGKHGKRMANIDAALRSFASNLKPEGQIILTFDVRYTEEVPLVWPGVTLALMMEAISTAGLDFKGGHGELKLQAGEDFVRHEEWGLAVYHCVLEVAS